MLTIAITSIIWSYRKSLHEDQSSYHSFWYSIYFSLLPLNFNENHVKCCFLNKAQLKKYLLQVQKGSNTQVPSFSEKLFAYFLYFPPFFIFYWCQQSICIKTTCYSGKSVLGFKRFGHFLDSDISKLLPYSFFLILKLTSAGIWANK